jgi:hypothetical protein
MERVRRSVERVESGLPSITEKREWQSNLFRDQFMEAACSADAKKTLAVPNANLRAVPVTTAQGSVEWSVRVEDGSIVADGSESFSERVGVSAGQFLPSRKYVSKSRF